MNWTVLMGKNFARIDKNEPVKQGGIKAEI